MTRKIFWFVIGIAIAHIAFADPDAECQGDPHHCTGGATGEITTEQTQTQGQDQNQGQEQAQDLEILGPLATANISSSFKRSASSAYAPTIYPTSPCLVCGSAGGSGAAFGISFGGCKIDKQCEEREVIRMAPTGGHQLFMWCHQELAVERFGEADCLTYKAPLQTDLADVTDEEFNKLKRQQAAQEKQIQELIGRLNTAATKAEQTETAVRRRAARKEQEDKDFADEVKAISERKYDAPDE
jgi:hypothetical protein